jgi:hypothetical protein
MATGAETLLTLPQDLLTVWWASPSTIQVSQRTANKLRLGRADASNGAVREWYDLPDIDVNDFAALKDHGWVWLPASVRNIAVTSDASAKVKLYPYPAWYNSVFQVAVSSDGKRVAFGGYKAPDEDSLGVSVLSLEDGTITQWFTTFGEGIRLSTADDGGFIIRVADTPEIMSLYRAIGPANIQKVGTLPRAILGGSPSRDWRTMAVVTRDQHGDAWMSKVVRH